jgi:hypothetical protein
LRLRLFSSRPWVACALLLAVSGAARAQIVSCPTGACGDQISRGFYVQNFAGSTLGTVQLSYCTNGTVGSYTVSLTVRSGAFNGPQVGTTQMATFSETGGAASFSFGNAAVTPGATLTFTQALVSGPPGGVVFYDVGPCPFGACSSCPNVVETEDTTPPLSTFRRGSVGVTITGVPSAPIVPVPALNFWGMAVLAIALAGTALITLSLRR